METFVDKLIEAINSKKSILCVGLDPQKRYIPEHILKQGYEEAENKEGFEPIARAIVIFNEAIIKATAPHAVVFKPQMAFYEAYGHWGVWAFEETVKMCKKKGVLVIEDAKRCDGGDTSKAYAAGHLGKVDIWTPEEETEETTQKPSFDVDAMTVVPWIGTSCLSPFVEAVKEFNKGIFIVDKTSFKPNSEIEQFTTTNNLKVWEELAKLVYDDWSRDTEGDSGFRNVGVVLGATYPEDAERMRQILPCCFFLVPGYGVQGGGSDGAVKGADDNGYGIIVNSSRGITYAYARDQFGCDPEEFAEAAAKAAEFAKNDLNAALERAGKLPWGN